MLRVANPCWGLPTLPLRINAPQWMVQLKRSMPNTNTSIKSYAASLLIVYLKAGLPYFVAVSTISNVRPLGTRSERHASINHTLTFVLLVEFLDFPGWNVTLESFGICCCVGWIWAGGGWIALPAAIRESDIFGVLLALMLLVCCLEIHS